MKKALLVVLSVLIIVTMAGCGKVDSVNEKIEAILSTNEITQKQLDDVFNAYDELSDKEKAEVSNYNKIEKYRGVDIDKVNEINSEISVITEKTAFDKLLKLQEKVEDLSSKEKALIDANKLENALTLKDIEKAAVAACQAIQSCLKNKSSFELESAKVINDLDGTTHYYLVMIEYSATNSFGGRKDNTSFQTISKEFENPWLPLGLLTGKYEEALQCSSFLQYYLLHDEDPAELNVDKILYYIEEDVSK